MLEDIKENIRAQELKESIMREIQMQGIYSNDDEIPFVPL